LGRTRSFPEKSNSQRIDVAGNRIVRRRLPLQLGIVPQFSRRGVADTLGNDMDRDGSIREQGSVSSLSERKAARGQHGY